jgi:hypothetical protein
VTWPFLSFTGLVDLAHSGEHQQIANFSQKAHACRSNHSEIGTAVFLVVSREEAHRNANVPTVANANAVTAISAMRCWAALFTKTSGAKTSNQW